MSKDHLKMLKKKYHFYYYHHSLINIESEMDYKDQNKFSLNLIRSPYFPINLLYQILHYIIIYYYQDYYSYYNPLI